MFRLLLLALVAVGVHADIICSSASAGPIVCANGLSFAPPAVIPANYCACNCTTTHTFIASETACPAACNAACGGPSTVKRALVGNAYWASNANGFLSEVSYVTSAGPALCVATKIPYNTTCFNATNPSSCEPALIGTFVVSYGSLEASMCVSAVGSNTYACGYTKCTNPIVANTAQAAKKGFKLMYIIIICCAGGGSFLVCIGLYAAYKMSHHKRPYIPDSDDTDERGRLPDTTMQQKIRGVAVRMLFRTSCR